MMSEMQMKLEKRRLAAMDPEERRLEEEKKKPVVVQTGDVKARMAALGGGNDQGGTQEAPKTAIMVNKNAPPPPPPPPPPKAAPPPPGGAKPKPPPANKPAPPPSVLKGLPPPPPIPKFDSTGHQIGGQAGGPPPPPQQQTQQMQPQQMPAPPPPPPQQNPPQQQQQQQQPQKDDAPSYPMPGQQQQQTNEVTYFVPQGVSYPSPEGASVDYPMPKSEQKKSSIPINYFWAIANRNVQQELNGIQFENKNEVMKLYPPKQNQQPHPSFQSILNDFRELDKNPEEAVMFINKKGKSTANFERFFTNDNNAWVRKQNSDALDQIRGTYSEQIEKFVADKSNNPGAYNSAAYEELDVVRYNGAIQKIQVVIETKVKTQQFGDIAKLSSTAQELEAFKKNFDSAPPNAKNAIHGKIKDLMTSIEAMQ